MLASQFLGYAKFGGSRSHGTSIWREICRKNWGAGVQPFSIVQGHQNQY